MNAERTAGARFMVDDAAVLAAPQLMERRWEEACRKMTAMVADDGYAIVYPSLLVGEWHSDLYRTTTFWARALSVPLS